MFRLNRDKSELIVLTGAVYSFVAYLTAFALELLFLIDLTRSNQDILASGQSSDLLINSSDSTFSQQQQREELEQEFSHITVLCLIVSILYFLIFIISLILTVALILRSTILLFIWLAAMLLMYLPELAAVVYLLANAWGIDTRNGRTELMFYLLRATLNSIFIYRAHKLLKRWRFERQFFKFKQQSGSQSNFSNFAYNSPYFIGGSPLRLQARAAATESLSTTINPLYSSTLNLSHYDHIRNFTQGDVTPASEHAKISPNQPALGYDNQFRHLLLAAPSAKVCQLDEDNRRRKLANQISATANCFPSRYQEPPSSAVDRGQETDSLSRNSLDSTSMDISGQSGANNRFANYGAAGCFHEIDLRGHRPRFHQHQLNSPQSQRNTISSISVNNSPSESQFIDDTRLDHNTYDNIHRHRDDHLDSDLRSVSSSNLNQQRRDLTPAAYVPESPLRHRQRTIDESPFAFSTNSLDQEPVLPGEQVILRTLEHRPFEYLQRPGSTSNLNTLYGISSQPGVQSSRNKLGK